MGFGLGGGGGRGQLLVVGAVAQVTFLLKHASSAGLVLDNLVENVARFHRERQRQTDRHRDRQRQRHTDRCTDRHTHIE